MLLLQYFVCFNNNFRRNASILFMFKLFSDVLLIEFWILSLMLLRASNFKLYLFTHSSHSLFFLLKKKKLTFIFALTIFLPNIFPVRCRLWTLLQYSMSNCFSDDFILSWLKSDSWNFYIDNRMRNALDSFEQSCKKNKRQTFKCPLNRVYGVHDSRYKILETHRSLYVNY